MRLYEGGVRKSFSILLRFSPFREALQTLYDFRKNLPILLQQDEINESEEDFWNFVAESLKNYKSKGGVRG
ncbi:MAG: hypothetical protein IMW83_04395 [Caldanaerobacter subterraneus]|nr:hypothetical protein [Caldanaerobacter subterraneus]